MPASIKDCARMNTEKPIRVQCSNVWLGIVLLGAAFLPGCASNPPAANCCCQREAFISRVEVPMRLRIEWKNSADRPHVEVFLVNASSNGTDIPQWLTRISGASEGALRMYIRDAKGESVVSPEPEGWALGNEENNAPRLSFSYSVSDAFGMNRLAPGTQRGIGHLALPGGVKKGMSVWCALTIPQLLPWETYQTAVILRSNILVVGSDESGRQCEPDLTGPPETRPSSKGVPADHEGRKETQR